MSISLSDLGTVTPDAGNPPAAAAITPSTGAPVTTPLDDAVAKTQQQDAEAAKAAADKAAADAANPPASDDQADDPANDPPADATPDPIAFWKDVDELRGVPIADKIDYGTTDPNTPEGVIIRDKYIEQNARLSMENFLEATYPRAYAFLLHSYNGGSEEDFFKDKIPTLPEYETFKSNIDLQSKVYKDDLVKRGIEPEEADALVNAAIKKGTDELFKKANGVYQRTQADITKQLEDTRRAVDEKEREEQRRVGELKTMLNSTISSDKLGIVIPEAERPAFTKFVSEMVREEGGKYYLLNPIDKDSINKLMESMYFLHKGGNLSAIVQRKARTLFTGTRADAVKNAGNRMPGGSGNAKKVTLGEM